jgi:universal stress protein A
MGYKHILAAIDLSEEAGQVLARARRLADEHHARLSICTVVKPLTHVYGGLDMMAYTQASVNFEEEARRQARAQVESEAGKVKVAGADVHVTVGSPASSVVETARAIDADLIVVGSH